MIDLDLQALWHWHCQRQALVTMVLRPDPAACSYGAVIVDADDRVRRINGRPASRGTVSGQETMFACVQVVDPQVLARIPADAFSTTTADVYPALIEHNEAVYGYRYTGYWMDIGVPERYLQAHWDLLDGVLGDAWVQRLPAGSRVVRRPDERPPGSQVSRWSPRWCSGLMSPSPRMCVWGPMRCSGPGVGWPAAPGSATASCGMACR